MKYFEIISKITGAHSKKLKEKYLVDLGEETKC